MNTLSLSIFLRNVHNCCQKTIWCVSPETEQAGLELNFWACILEVLGSDLDREAGYPEIFMVLLSPSRHMSE
jgi:hypothetical protein